MIDTQTLNAVSERIGDLLPMHGATRMEMRRGLRNALQLGLAPLDPVTRPEFEALRLMLRYLRERLDNLGPRVAELERLQRANAEPESRVGPLRLTPAICYGAVTAGSLDSGLPAFSRICP